MTLSGRFAAPHLLGLPNASSCPPAFCMILVWICSLQILPNQMSQLIPQNPLNSVLNL